MAIDRLFKTTAFKIALAYSVVFAAAVGFVIANIGREVGEILEDQISETIDADIRGLADLYEQGGLRRVVEAVERRIKSPGTDIYLLTTSNGAPLAGNIAALPAAPLQENGLVETAYERADEKRPKGLALARIYALPGGFKLLVGQDIEQRETLRTVLRKSLLNSLGWLVIVGGLGGLLVARRVLMRVDRMSASARNIMSGDLSDRLPTIGSGDELDRLANNLNAMLQRIEGLMRGLQEVTENIAHDLRTPLTRLRNQAEAALRKSDADRQSAATLEKIIDEADNLIKIFDALLMIARAESGAGPKLEVIDLAPVIRDIAELYEASVEELGGALNINVASDLFVNTNREMIAMALTNLLDNALKYAVLPNRTLKIDIVAAREENKIRITVADNGPGVPAEDRPRILKRFVRLEKSRSVSGSGLGLSLVAAIAHLSSGQIELNDNAPGLRAALVLPRARRSPEFISDKSV